MAKTAGEHPAATQLNVATVTIPHGVHSLPFALRACTSATHDPATSLPWITNRTGTACDNLTWSQLYRRTLNVAQELSPLWFTGVVISAQGNASSPFSARYEGGRIAVPAHFPPLPMNVPVVAE